MSSIRLGLCCLFRDEPIKFRTTRVSYIKKLIASGQSPLEFIGQLILDNLTALLATLDYCARHKIGSFRIGSDFLPVFTHAEVGYTLARLPQAALILERFALCKSIAEQAQIRLTFHPDQFVVLNSPHQQVVVNSIAELEYHAELAELLGADVINIHAGGVYGNKEKALNQFKANFHALSERAQKLLTIENDDKCFTPEDLLPLCEQLRIPLVYDVHHHRCLSDTLSLEEASDRAYATWGDREPLFHLSSPLEGWQGPKPAWHHDYIDIRDFPLYWFEFPRLTVDVEAKAKERAVLKLAQDFNSYKNKIFYS